MPALVTMTDYNCCSRLTDVVSDCPLSGPAVLVGSQVCVCMDPDSADFHMG